MTIQNNYLENVAKAVNGEAFNSVTHHGVTDDDTFTVDVDLSSLQGEIGSRNTTSASRSLAVITYNSLRVGAADVVDTINGDDLHGASLFDASTGGNPQIAIELPGTNQTINFDLEFDYEITFERSN